MFGHWMVVASQKTAKVFTEVDERYRLKLVGEFDNPLGRERNRDMIRHKAGTGTKSMGRSGTVHTAKVKRSDPHEMAAIQFAKEITDFLNAEFEKKNFTKLTVIAEPHFLGTLRSAMKSKVEGSVAKWVKKDLLKTPKLELEKILLTKKRKKLE